MRRVIYMVNPRLLKALSHGIFFEVCRNKTFVYQCPTLKNGRQCSVAFSADVLRSSFRRISKLCKRSVTSRRGFNVTMTSQRYAYVLDLKHRKVYWLHLLFINIYIIQVFIQAHLSSLVMMQCQRHDMSGKRVRLHSRSCGREILTL